ncbi:MAG: Maf family protein [Alphaproteobacteria bacterium]
MGTDLILASASPSRTRILHDAGVHHVVEPAGIDEEEIKASLAAAGAVPQAVSETLAELKATQVGTRRPGALVIGADQVLEYADRLFDKPRDLDHARAHLVTVRGRIHRLVASVCVVRDGRRLWHHNDTAELQMRDFSDDFLDWYLAKAGRTVCQSVGAYQLEGLGAHLFARVRGDYFTILGLPLLPLLEFLRGYDMVPR